MKLLILQEKLKQGLNVVSKLTPKSLTLPILNNILLNTEKNFLELASTDLEIGIKYYILTKIEKQGKTTIPSQLFFNFINLLPNKNINIELKKNNLDIVCENYKTQINTISADEFPIIPILKETENITIDNSLFCESLKQIVDIASLSNSKPEISGVYLCFQKNQLIITATDSFRLGEKKIFFKKPNLLKKEYSLILPQKTIKYLINVFSEKTGEIKISFSLNQIMFESSLQETPHPEIQLVSKLVDGEYPNYQEIIPKKFTTEAVFKKEELLNQIKSASLFSKKTNEIKIKLNIKKGEMDICSSNNETGEYQSTLKSKIKGKNEEIIFNYKFLIDGLLNIKSSEVLFGFNGDSGPSVLKPVGDQSYIYIVMPIKT
ncbi:MAG: DNA polymerase III subunit beta [Candidatus Pacebacteria bacterium]|nr:DNA polymerase III subunit beta [Candidatus Paceibacterota bacterium]